MDKQKVLDAITPRVKASLKSPSSAVMCPASDLIITSKSANEYLVSGYVDSQNSYGAMLRTNFKYIINVDNNGNIGIIRGGVGEQSDSAKSTEELGCMYRFVLYGLLLAVIVGVIYILVAF